MKTRVRQKSCQRCLVVSDRLFRVQADSSKQWLLLCPSCQRLVSADNPEYVYGGTWKATKRH